MIKILKQQASPSIHNLNLDVEQSGMTITIRSGDFRMKRKDYILSEDFVHAVKKSDIRRFINAYLVLDNSNKVRVIADEVISGLLGADIKDYTYLSWLYKFSLPANVNTLDDIEIVVRNIVSSEGV